MQAAAQCAEKERRHSSKSPPLVENQQSDAIMTAVRHRAIGKQGHKKSLQDLFPQAPKTVLKSAFGMIGGKSVLL